MRTVVVLPAPLGPSRATTSPAPTLRSSPRRTGTRESPRPNDFVRQTASTGMGDERSGTVMSDSDLFMCKTVYSSNCVQ